MSYYGYNRDAYGEYLAHKGKKGAKWGYTNGKKNGKRTAKGRSVDKIKEEAKKLPKGSSLFYNHKGKRYMLDSVKDNGIHYKSGNHTIIVRKGEKLKTVNMGTLRDGKKSTTYVSEGKAAQTKRKVKVAKNEAMAKVTKASKNLDKKAKKISKAAKVKSKEVAKKAAKGKKKLMSMLKKKKKKK